ncbi:Initiation factor subunit 2 family protein [Trichostrongylus colubriformis]|uniref:Initiation factor subunit 2 family protein n=1 Tax=Trichostrongylus colubriformis TaxID=6319 RepID=A0AAN8FDX9_TRICO
MNFVVNGPIPADFMINSKERLAAYRFNGDTHELSVLEYKPQQTTPSLVAAEVNPQDDKSIRDAIRANQIEFTKISFFSLIRLYSSRLGIRMMLFLSFVICRQVAYLLESRPTAINLRNALDHISEVGKGEGDVITRRESVAKAILKLVSDEAEENRRLIWNGYQEVSFMLFITRVLSKWFMHWRRDLTIKVFD